MCTRLPRTDQTLPAPPNPCLSLVRPPHCVLYRSQTPHAATLTVMRHQHADLPSDVGKLHFISQLKADFDVQPRSKSPLPV